MLDFIKLYSRDIIFANQIYRNPLLQAYEQKQRQYKDRTQTTHVKEYKGILFYFFQKDKRFTKVEIHIKPHYYFNDNLHNANDFKIIDVINTLIEIIKLFDLPAKQLKVIGLEYGINIQSPIPIQELIDKTIYHEKNIFNNSSDDLRYSKISYKPKPNGKANDYKKIKFYAKGLQYPKYCHKDTLRIEVKSKKSKFINQFGIYTLNDLLNPNIYHLLAQSLQIEIDKLLILYHKNYNNLSEKEKIRLDKYLNTHFWQTAQNKHRNYFSKNKLKYFELLNKTGYNIHTELNKIAGNKINNLIKLPDKKRVL